eukprot:CAMPEP_0203810792 /NCGR_PEP_ID=MMETSP0115-20131106/3157_1 /ASSEMBLY_ACC=CAM_ASM_000227 /TAXON_ID=33651 /ORGANISM="Bicosoecid sp, Strain ms1" /LENGTH=423 /DNA_ID=CAMNT_0050719595 /DNA_START=184 /DNA_END=1451 /DNA_ORIENTATION=-
MAGADKVARLFTELSGQIEREDYKKALTTSTRILAIAPGDGDASICKALAHVHLGQVEEALAAAEAAPAAAADDAAFVRAYCLYRLNRLTDASEALSSSDHADVSYQHIAAQVHYRLNEFAESLALYEAIAREDEDGATSELATNMAAALARSGGLSALEHPLLKLSDHPNSYELAYNLAWSHVAAGNWAAAQRMLESARDTCVRSLTEEEFNPGEIANEAAILRVQLGYVLQQQRKTEEALEEYQGVLRQKPSDESVAAVASNNIVSLRGNAELFDSFKRNRQVMAEGLQRKLMPQQRMTFAFNRCVLLLYMRRLADARTAVAALQEEYPDEATPWLLEAALLREEGRPDAECEACLKGFVERRAAVEGDDAARTQARVALAHFAAETGRPGEAADLLRNIDGVGTSLGGAATAVALYRQAG